MARLRVSRSAPIAPPDGRQRRFAKSSLCLPCWSATYATDRPTGAAVSAAAGFHRVRGGAALDTSTA